MRIFLYLRRHKAAVALVFALILVQAFCELALPTFTSDIVDVGIQQAGVEHAAVDEMTERTFEKVAMLLPEDDEDLLRRSYERTAQGTLRLNAFGEEHRRRLDEALEGPLVLLHRVASARQEAAGEPSRPDAEVPGADAPYEEALSLLGGDDLYERYRAGEVAKDEVLAAERRALDAMPESQRAILGQQALAAARQEYEAAGFDVAGLQQFYLLRAGALMLAVAALGMAASAAIGFVASRTAAKVGAELRGRLFDRVASFSEADIARFSAASLITRSTNDVQQVQNVTAMLLRMVLYAPVVTAGGIFMVVTTNAAMGWVIVLAVVCIFALIGVLMKVVMPKFKIMQKLVDRVNLVAREMLTGVAVVRAFGRQSYEERRFDAANAKLRDTQLFTSHAMAVMMPALMLVMNGVSVLIVWAGAGYVDAGALQTGDLIAFITYAMVVVSSFLMIGMVSVMLPRADVSRERIDEVLSFDPTVRDPASPEAADARLRSGKGPASIEFRGVSFSYGDASEDVLTDVSFVAEAGKTTAIVGSTGSGKSTLLKLVERFYDVSAGSVTVDGVDVRDASLRALREQLGYVPQTSFLFDGTVRSNVAFSDESMDDARVARALSIAQASSFVAKLPEGEDSPISQGGTNVSGGQRQRLCIARALASPARAYLFDDSFSALDYRTDADLREALATEASDKTVLVVAQRIATVMHAHRIVVLDDGKVVGQGTHEELLRDCRTYREIAFSQLSEDELMGGEAA